MRWVVAQMQVSLPVMLACSRAMVEEDFRAEMRRILESLTRGIVNKIAHGPISELRRQAGRPDGVQIIHAIRQVFHLKD